jgi:hypothetical protein
MAGFDQALHGTARNGGEAAPEKGVEPHAGLGGFDDKLFRAGGHGF